MIHSPKMAAAAVSGSDSSKAKGLSGSRMPVSNRAAVADACGKNHASSDGIRGSCCGCKEKELVGRQIHRPSPSRPHPQPCYQPAPPPAMCFQTGLGLQHQHIQTSTGLVFSHMKTTSEEHPNNIRTTNPHVSGKTSGSSMACSLHPSQDSHQDCDQGSSATPWRKDMDQRSSNVDLIISISISISM